MSKIAKFDLPKILPHIGKPCSPPWILNFQGQGYPIPVSSSKMKLMKKTQICACCGLQGTFFDLEIRGNNNPHLNLYGVGPRNSHVMLTVDHIVPRSKGGTRDMSNVQLLCARCNNQKGNKIITIEELRRRISPKIEKEL